MWTCLGVVSGCIFWMACVFEGRGQMPLVLKMCPKYWISLEKKWHLLNFMESFADQSFSNTFLICDRCSSAALLNIIMSSKYAIVKSKSFNIPVINSWKYAGAWANLKGFLDIFIFSKRRIECCFRYQRLVQRDMMITGPQIHSVWKRYPWPLAWAKWISLWLLFNAQ